MITAEKDVELRTIASQMEFAANTLANVAKSIEYVADNMDQPELFPTIVSIREDLQQDMKDLKSALAQLENADAQLQRLQG